MYLSLIRKSVTECDRVEEKEQKETKGRLNLKVDSQEAAGKSLVPSEVEVIRGC